MLDEVRNLTSYDPSPEAVDHPWRTTAVGSSSEAVSQTGTTGLTCL